MNNEEDKEDHESSSTSSSNSLSMESAGYFSPGSASKSSSLDNIPKAAAAATTDGQSMKSENSCYSLEDMSEVVKETLNVEPVWSTYKPEEREEEDRGREVEKLMKENGDLRNKYQNLESKSSTRMKELEDKVAALKLEIEERNHRDHEKEFKGGMELDKLRSQNDEDRKKLLREKEKELESLRIQKQESEKELQAKIAQCMDRIQHMQTEVDSLWSQKDEARKKFLREKEKDVECLKIQNRESEMEIKEKTKEVADGFEKILKGKLAKSMDRVQNVQTELDSLRKKFSYQKEKERIRNEGLEMEFNSKTREAVDECERIFKGKFDQFMDRIQSIQMEVDTLRYQNFKARKKLYDVEKEFEILSMQNRESEYEMKKKTKESADSQEALETMREKLKEKTMNEEDLKSQVNNMAVMIARINVENEKQQNTIYQLNDENQKQKSTISQINDENEQQKTAISRLKDEREKQTATIAQLTGENEKQKSRISQLNDENEKQKATISRLNDEYENQKATISQLQSEYEKQKTANSQLNDANEKQKATISRSNDEHEKQKARISQLTGENDKQKATISQLEKKLQAKDTQISTLESKSETVKKELSNKMKALEIKYKSLELDKKELEGKNDVLAVTLEQKEMQADKLTDEAKSSFKMSVKKMGEMLNEFRKSQEDNTRILSRRIQVAEQLHNETRDWYKKTKDKFEQDKVDSDMNVRTIKLLMTMVNETLKVTETYGLRFVECCEDFMNRVSKVSCEINSAKDWVSRKNEAMVQVKDDYDSLVTEMYGKEEEVLRSRQKVLKLENKLRELEKIVKENREAIITLKEEKREAIRHLCVWTDYHRSRADFLTKSLSDLLTRNPRPV